MQDLDPSDICKKKFLNPLKRIRVIIRTPTHGRTDGRTDRQTDRRTDEQGESSIPPPKLRFGGYNYANPVYGVATICHQVLWLRWGHPSLFHTATSLLIWYKMFCVRDISHRLIWMEFINKLSVYAQSEMHSRFNWWIIVVLTYHPSVLICVWRSPTPPNSTGNVQKHGHLLQFLVSGR